MWEPHINNIKKKNKKRHVHAFITIQFKSMQEHAGKIDNNIAVIIKHNIMMCISMEIYL